MTGQIISIGIADAILMALLGWHIWRMFRPGNCWLDHPMVFFLLVFPAMLTLRLPEICWPREINVDESQMLAQAFRYLSHPIPWRDVDGTTSGPLDSWFLSGPIFFGAPVSWAMARTMLLVAQGATMIFIYLALRCFGTRADAQMALMPTVLFYAFAAADDSIHYSSETLPVLLLAIMVWLLCRAWMTGKFSGAGLFFTGFLAGCVPFAKLQATPMAVFLLAVGLGQIFLADRKNPWPKIGLILFGAAVFPCVLLGVVAVCGAASDFWTSYILAPAAYSRESLGTKLVSWWALFTLGKEFRSYLVSALAGGILLAAAWSHVRKPRPGTKLLAALAAIIGLCVVANFCMVMPGKGFRHYLLLLIPAQAVFFGLVLAIGKRLLLAPEENDPKISPKPIHLFLTGFALVVGLQAGKAPGFFNASRTLLAQPNAERKSFVARRILKASRPGDTLSVWGWMPGYYVETGLMPATRDAIGHFMIEEGPYRDYYRQRYLNDLKRSPPEIFVDAMASGVFTWTWTTLKPHETFPELNTFIDDNYFLWLSVHITTLKGQGWPVRIYLSKQRMADLHLAPEELTVPADPSLAPE